MRIRAQLKAGGLLLAAVAAAGLLLAYVLPATADHIAGATYTGTHDGGGMVDFDLSGDGSGIARFRVTDLPGDFCTFGEVEINFGSPWPIENHAFSRQVSSGLSFEGMLLPGGNAEGTLRNVVVGTCDSGVVNWTASTDATPGPTDSPSPTPPPTATPGPTPIPLNQLHHGDVDCSANDQSSRQIAGNGEDGVDIGDAIKIARFIIALDNVAAFGCPEFDDLISTIIGPFFWADVNCDGLINIGDAIAIARYLIHLTVNTPDGCPPIGELLFGDEE